MRLHLVAVGRRLPAWVRSGYREYARRLPPECPLDLHEIAPGARGRGADTARAVRTEGERMLRALPAGARVLALDERGTAWDTRELARELSGWMRDGDDLALLVGGPDGLAQRCLDRARQRWSLSPLTLPHGLVRILVAEQLYRAWSILAGHPYHRD
ncbi:MAG TPA: 23S rRNA (pseudouridine(1915)-N(3))-methyltransferase RlmH [Gammaproteobacteria bacterium]|nr:23S rRNA (pseudouridine(1915)-N(3))-methyltransferase RlmH [Gammaproteobacteria bacterium]